MQKMREGVECADDNVKQMLGYMDNAVSFDRELGGLMRRIRASSVWRDNQPFGQQWKPYIPNLAGYTHEGRLKLLEELAQAEAHVEYEHLMALESKFTTEFALTWRYSNNAQTIDDVQRKALEAKICELNKMLEEFTVHIEHIDYAVKGYTTDISPENKQRIKIEYGLLQREIGGHKIGIPIPNWETFETVTREKVDILNAAKAYLEEFKAIVNRELQGRSSSERVAEIILEAENVAKQADEAAKKVEAAGRKCRSSGFTDKKAARLFLDLIHEHDALTMKHLSLQSELERYVPPSEVSGKMPPAPKPLTDAALQGKKSIQFSLGVIVY
ncbi:MAG: hypothetical protein ACQCN5_03820 [Candidatus Bathyarchaeia archaeon]